MHSCTNAELEFERNQRALRLPALGAVRLPQLPGGPARHRHRPPGQPGIPGSRGLHLGRRRGGPTAAETPVAYPDTLVGTDSHTTMINGLGVLGWGVGGIEAEAAMLGQPVSMLVPQVVGFRLHGQLPEGATATDLVLTVTQMLRRRKAWSASSSSSTARAWSNLPLADRATIAQHGPGIWRHLRHLPDRRSRPSASWNSPAGPPSLIRLVESYAKEQGSVPRRRTPPRPTYSDTLELDIVDRRALPRRPEAPAGPRPLSEARASFEKALAMSEGRSRSISGPATSRRPTRRANRAWKARAAAARPSAPRTPPPRRRRIARCGTATSPTARSSSPPSPAAPTRRTPRS